MKFIFAVLSLIVAEEIIRLEPVSASSTNNYGCNALSGEANCRSSPYCYYAASATNANKRCIDDPCLLYLSEGTCSAGFNLDDQGVGLVACSERTLSNFQNHDCGGNPGTGKLCAQTAVDKTVNYTYCVYTQLKDGSCPDSICMKRNNGAAVEKHCVKNNVAFDALAPCKMLTQADCKLVPKCYWESDECKPDPCFQKKPNNVACSGIEGGNFGTFATGTCVDWHPLSSADGTALNYCIHKNNADANICYFGNINVTTAGDTDDYPYDYSPNWKKTDDRGTYPTYNYQTGANEANPVCETDGLSTCEGKGTCKTIVNTKGALAGKYCTDGEHAAANANILRVPSLLVFLFILVSIFSL